MFFEWVFGEMNRSLKDYVNDLIYFFDLPIRTCIFKNLKKKIFITFPLIPKCHNFGDPFSINRIEFMCGCFEPNFVYTFGESIEDFLVKYGWAEIQQFWRSF
jgi:hypothetical protein